MQACPAEQQCPCRRKQTCRTEVALEKRSMGSAMRRCGAISQQMMSTLSGATRKVQQHGDMQEKERAAANELVFSGLHSQ